MIGSILKSRYEVIAALQSGPIFSTFQGRDQSTGKDVCIRAFKPPFNAEREFLEAVGKAALKSSAVNHPGVERIEALEDLASRPFLVGPYTPGVPLSDRIRKLAPFSIPVAIGNALSILEGLQALHTAGLVHGDVSAENVLIGADGSARLQLACIWEAYSRSATAGAVVLPAMASYLAPEISSGGVPSPRSDVYSVGILLFELLCGRLPYAAETPVAMAMKHATAPTPAIKSYNQSAPVVLDEIVKKAMSKDPALRYPSASSMLSDLKVLQEALRFGKSITWPLTGSDLNAAEPVQVAPKMSAVRASIEKKQRSRVRSVRESEDVPGWVIGAIGALALVVLVGGFFMWGYLNLGKRKMVAVPALKGKDVSEARTLLHSLKLEMREIGHETSERYPAQTILSSDPDGGEKAKEGSTIGVMVSTGSQLVEVPDLTGMELDTARSVLHNLNLNVQEPVERVNSDRPKDQVVSQEPAAKQKLNKEAGVRLKVSDGVPPAGPPPAAPTTSPAPTSPSTTDGTDSASQSDSGNPPGSPVTKDTGQANPANDAAYTYSLHIRLRGLQSGVQVRVDMEDSRGTSTVFDEPHSPDDAFEVTAKGYGPSVTFRIYYDDVLKRTIRQSGQPRHRVPTEDSNQ